MLAVEILLTSSVDVTICGPSAKFMTGRILDTAIYIEYPAPTLSENADSVFSAEFEKWLEDWETRDELAKGARASFAKRILVNPKP